MSNSVHRCCSGSGMERIDGFDRIVPGRGRIDGKNLVRKSGYRMERSVRTYLVRKSGCRMERFVHTCLGRMEMIDRRYLVRRSGHRKERFDLGNLVRIVLGSIGRGWPG